jgi:hypothetical protein
MNQKGIIGGKQKMNEKQRQLAERVGKLLKMNPDKLKHFSLEDIIFLLVGKMENDMIDVDDMFDYMNDLKERK